jgi:hypothetical protein
MGWTKQNKNNLSDPCRDAREVPSHYEAEVRSEDSFTGETELVNSSYSKYSGIPSTIIRITCVRGLSTN